jgi:chaperone modulatory protein CbpM
MSEKLFSISFNELCELEGIESQLVLEIVEYEIVIPLNRNTKDASEEHWVFDTDSLQWIKKALRLRRDLEIDWVAIAMVIDLMRQKEALQGEIESYQRQLDRFLSGETH